ncbi:hypothetical protein LTR37_011609 [Vermiconidia calcicola]|uniref:Uncharacterized protein n=1 Tax=Vermiconidia calcicola TaxID=1690605 RepID=A0ACC3N1T1_9PEZI|nr:hypothetical protein LTR37_011609 [Vermiconidia calcicola]
MAKVELIVDPPPVAESAQTGTEPFPRTDLRIRIAEKPSSLKRAAPNVRTQPQKSKVAVLNMASALRPGGGFLEGANGQEEFLCARSTLYPSLWDEFYRLPEVSAVHTPDVLVFRENDPDAHDLHRNDRYFIDVISSSMLRFSDAKGDGCSCGVSYCDRHRDLVLRKMKAVLRIAQSKGVEKLVLGAWGCGSYGNPVKEVAKAWRKVIAGAPRQRRPNAERWEGINEIVFAIPDQTMLGEFERAFSDVLASDLVSESEDGPVDSGVELSEDHARTSELLSRMAEIEMQIEQVHNSRLKNTLRQTLADLGRELNQGTRATASKDEDQALESDEEIDDFVVSGFAGSDGEDNSFYNLDSDSSDSTGPPGSDVYEFRPGRTNFDPQASQDEEDSQDESLYPVLSHSPQFDPETGWYNGSMEGLTALISGAGGLRDCSRTSPKSPDVVRPTSSALPGIDVDALHGYLNRYQGTDVMDY